MLGFSHEFQPNANESGIVIVSVVRFRNEGRYAILQQLRQMHSVQTRWVMFLQPGKIAVSGSGSLVRLMTFWPFIHVH